MPKVFLRLMILSLSNNKIWNKNVFMTLNRNIGRTLRYYL